MIEPEVTPTTIADATAPVQPTDGKTAQTAQPVKPHHKRLLLLVILLAVFLLTTTCYAGWRYAITNRQSTVHRVQNGEPKQNGATPAKPPAKTDSKNLPQRPAHR